MDLKIDDVADLLNVSKTTILGWIADGKIPTYRINQHNEDYLFSRSEIQNWMISHKLDTTQGASPFQSKQMTILPIEKKGGSKQFSLFRAIHKGGVLSSVKGETKEEVIKATMKELSKNLPFDAEMMTELLLDRENMMPTALSNGVAVPHTRDTLISGSQDIIWVVFPEKPLQYGALDKKPVHTLFFLFACEDKRHLHLLAKIAHLSHQQESLGFLQTKPSKEQLMDFVKQWESSVPQIGGK